MSIHFQNANEKWNIPNLIQKKQKILLRILNLLSKTFSQRKLQVQMALLVSSTKHLKMKSYQSYMLFQKEGTLPKCFYEAAITQISKPKKDFMEKITDQYPPKNIQVKILNIKLANWIQQYKKQNTYGIYTLVQNMYFLHCWNSVLTGHPVFFLDMSDNPLSQGCLATSK